MPVFIPITKKGDVNEYSNYQTIVFISHADKDMLKNLPARLQQYLSQKLKGVQAGFIKGRGTRSNCQHSLDHGESKGVPESHLCLLH